MRDLARHQETRRVFHAGIVSYVNQSLIDDLCAGFRGYVGAEISSRLPNGIDISRRPRRAAGIDQRGSATVKQRERVAFAALRDLRQQFAIAGAFGELAFYALVHHQMMLPITSRWLSSSVVYISRLLCMNMKFRP